MKRKDFFKKLGLGAAGVVMSPAILEALDKAKAKPTVITVKPKTYGMLQYTDGLQKEINKRYLEFTKQLEKQMLYGMPDIDDPHWTPAQVEYLKRTAK